MNQVRLVFTHQFNVLLMNFCIWRILWPRRGRWSENNRKKKIPLSNAQKKTDRAYATGRQKEEDGGKFACSKHDRAITCVFYRELHLKLPCSCLLQKDLFKERWGLGGIFLHEIIFTRVGQGFSSSFLWRPIASSLITREMHFNKTLR